MAAGPGLIGDRTKAAGSPGWCSRANTGFWDVPGKQLPKPLDAKSITHAIVIMHRDENGDEKAMVYLCIRMGVSGLCVFAWKALGHSPPGHVHVAFVHLLAGDEGMDQWRWRPQATHRPQTSPETHRTTHRPRWRIWHVDDSESMFEVCKRQTRRLTHHQMG
jgi:hypothetical protein